ncbi:MAG TPA: TonB-dependent receptor, partial [Acidobacteriota bacterium]|nr:TonB-dependent receptor [Acidobacteriota bacterium]
MKLAGRLFLTILLLMTASIGWLAAEDEQPATTSDITTSETVQVTASRLPEAVEPEPASLTIVTGDQLRATGAMDLASAMNLVAGVSIAQGSDGGPASSVPELWGLREFDAFLLVVDNVPWGGAFNPSLATLDLNDIDRIEVMRGAAPVMYGATSFVGVIHVIHMSADQKGDRVSAYGGNYGTGGASGRYVLPSGENWKNALSANFDSQGYKTDRTDFKKGHILYRGQSMISDGLFHVDVDLTFLRQHPASPRPRVDEPTEPELIDPEVPLDSNQNPSDSKFNEDRYHFVAGYDHKVGGADWSILGAYSHETHDITRGFLSVVSNEEDPNTAGFRQNQTQNDLYLDSHFAWKLPENVKLLVGADYLYGKGETHGDNFDYFINLDGSNPPNSFDFVVQERPQLEDTRNFFGLYSQVEWSPTARWLIQGGLRFNSTHEKQHGEVLPGDVVEPVALPFMIAQEGESEGSESTQTNNRLSGTVGVSYQAVDSAENKMWLFADYRNAFKPAAVDFGPEAEGSILEPETAISYEGGVKGNSWNDRLYWEVSVFRMDFENLVTSAEVNGLPVLINSGKDRFTGVEIGTAIKVYEATSLQVSYSYHNAKFVDFTQLPEDPDQGTEPIQLAGNRLEMSPHNLAAIGIVYNPVKGFNGSFVWNYVGQRFLDRLNEFSVDGFSTLQLGVGYRIGRNNFRFD